MLNIVKKIVGTAHDRKMKKKRAQWAKEEKVSA